jgi:AcrR family transcriptional regulator
MRERYYEATIARIAAEGVAGARVRDIVDDAGGSWGSYHHYFPRKEDALIERIARRVHSLRPAVDAALADEGASVREAVEQLLTGFAEPEGELALHGAAIREAMSHPLRLVEMLNGELPPVGLVGLLLQAGQERGQVHTDADPFSLAAVLTAGTVFPVLQTAFGDRIHGFEDAARPPDPAAGIRTMLAISWRAVAP